MESILKHHIQRKKFSHGYLFYGDRERALRLIEKTARCIFCEHLSHCGSCAACNLELRQNPNFFSYSFDKFQIDASRDIKELAFKKSFGGGSKIFQLIIKQAGREAENATLKLLEEPPPNTYFLIYTPFLDNVLETIKSRMVLIWSGPPKLEIKEDAKNLIQMSFNDKLDSFSRIKDRDKAKDLILGFMAELQKNKPLSSDNCLKIKKLEEGIKLLNQSIPFNLIGLYIFT